MISSWRNNTNSKTEVEWVVNDRPDLPSTRWITYPRPNGCRVELSLKNDNLQILNPWLTEAQAWKTALLHELAHCEQPNRIKWDEDEPFWRVHGWSREEISTLWRGMKMIYLREADGKVKRHETRAMAAFMEIEADIQSAIWMQDLFPLHYDVLVKGLAKYRSSLSERDAWHDSSWALNRLLSQKRGVVHGMVMDAVLKNASMDVKRALARGVSEVQNIEARQLQEWLVLKLGDNSSFSKACALKPASYFECSQKAEKLVHDYLEPYKKLEQRLVSSN